MSSLQKKIRHLEAVRERLEYHINAAGPTTAVAKKQAAYIDGNFKRFEKEAIEIEKQIETRDWSKA